MSQVKNACAAWKRDRNAPSAEGNPKVKYAKTAAFVAGSVVALGTAGPGIAGPAEIATSTTPSRLSLTTGVNDVMASTPQIVEPVVGMVVGAADSIHDNGTVTKLTGEAEGAAKGAAPLIGGLPVGG